MKAKRISLVIALLLAWTTGAKAAGYITDVMLIGSGEYLEAQALKRSYEAQGWTFINQDLNENAGGDFIYLLYKADSWGANNGNCITDFYIKTGQGRPASISHNGRTYYPVPGGGNDTFNNSACDLNRDADGEYVYLYYTKESFDDFRVVESINFNDVKSGAVPANGSGDGYDLNKGVGGDFIYMHITTATAETAQVVWCSGNATLYFTCSSTRYTAGSTFNGQTVTNSWCGSSVTNTGWSTPGWHEVAGSVKYVVFDSSFELIRPKSLRWWFCEMENLEAITRIDYLNTSEVTVLNSTFYQCSKLTTIDLSGFDVGRVSNVTSMFAYCSSLTTIYSNDTWTAAASDNLFTGCTKLRGAVSFNNSNTGISMANPNTGYFTGQWLLSVVSDGRGTMVADKIRPHTNEKVTMTALTDEGYLFAAVSVEGKRTGNAIDVTDNGDGTFAFTMPAEDVVVRPTFRVPTTMVSYIDLNGEQQTVEAKVVHPAYTSLEDGWWAVTDDIATDKRLTVNGDVHLILCDGKTLDNSKGTTVNGGNSLTVWAQSEGTGAWTVDNPGDNDAGIGGHMAPSGIITINGGCLTVTGGKNSAGIGGGYAYRYMNGSSKTSNVVINGGTIDATGGLRGAGIGCGEYGDAEVTIAGGIVNAIGGADASGLGNGYSATTSAVTMTYTDDVSITASSYGGSVTLSKNFTDRTTLFEEGLLNDNSPLAGKTLRPHLTGDMDLNGQVTIADVALLLDKLLQGTKISKAADVSRDGLVTIADVTLMVDIILGKAVGGDDGLSGIDSNYDDIEYDGGGSGAARSRKTGVNSRDEND